MQYENVETSALENNNFRKVLFTNRYSQVVLMSIPPGEDIGSEVHERPIENAAWLLAITNWY